MQFSPQQAAVIEAMGSLIVEARAGSGKTTTILEAAIRGGSPTTLLCAFNKRIADELTQRITSVRLPRGRMIKAQTLHSIGFEIVRHNEPGTTIDRDATDELVKLACPSLPFKAKRAVVKAVRYLKETCFSYTTAADIRVIIERLELDSPTMAAAELALGAFEAMALSRGQRTGTIDFCDMIWRPYAMGLAPKGRYKTIFVDEAQDMTLGQFSMVERLLAPGGRIVVVGDLHQEIYDWKGAAGPQIWAQMEQRYGAKRLPLTWSFRCGQAIIKQAQVLVPSIEAAPGAGAGTVDSLRLKAALDVLAPGDFFLSRNNSGAITSAIRAALRGKAVHVLGNYDDLDPLLDLIKQFDTSAQGLFISDVMAWRDKQLDRSDITDARADLIEDRATLLIEAATLVAPHKLDKVLRKVFYPSAEQADKATLFSTVHKAKGLEADRVFLLKESFLRHRRRHDGRQRTLVDVPIEEQNVEYVAITRARSHLTWVLPDFAEAGIDLHHAADLSVDDDFGAQFKIDEERQGLGVSDTPVQVRGKVTRRDKKTPYRHS